MGELPGGFGPGDRRAAYVRALYGDLPTAFTIRCSAQNQGCGRSRGVALALPPGAEHALVLLPTMAAQLPILIERNFTGVVTGPLCPRKGHNEFKDKGIAHVAPGAPKAKEIAEKFESSGSTRTVIVCVDLGALRPGFEEFHRTGKPGIVWWSPGESDTLLKPEWQRTAIRIQPA
ncbi:hypothetical protein ACIPPN_28875 [Streptomyces diastaticus]|nr:hypothetical protein [Streptomyces diastaticus]